MAWTAALIVSSLRLQKWEGDNNNDNKAAASTFLMAVFGAPVGYVFYEKGLSPGNWAYQGGKPSGGVHGAPGPSLLAGSPPQEGSVAQVMQAIHHPTP
jgi:hypothetical protein